MSALSKDAFSERLKRAIAIRLGQIEERLKTQVLSQEPSFADLLWHRWRCVPLRDESRYLLERLSEL